MRWREKERRLNRDASGEKSDGNAKGKRRVKGMENGSIDRERRVNRDERRMREGKGRGRVCDGSESS